MAINPSTQYPGRITAPDANYTYGSSKNETSPGAGDGTPYEIARANDVFGFQQALLNLASIVPSGNAETQLISQYLQALVELASGRATNYDESGVANAYSLDLRTNQQGPAVYYDGMLSEFIPSANNTGATTANVAALGVKNVFFLGAALRGGELLTTRKAVIEYDLANDRHNLILKQDGDYIAVESASGRAYNYDESGAVNAYVLDTQANQVGPKSYFDGLRADFFPGANNTGASTVNVAGLGIKNIFLDGAALTGGELVTTKKAVIEYDLGNDRVNLILIPTGAVSPSSVGQAELKTNTGEVSTSSGSDVNLTLPGGMYGFYPQTRETGDGMSAKIANITTDVGVTYVTNITLSVDTSGTAYAQQRYVTASPPYNLGDGDIPLFIFALVDNVTGKITSVYAAPEAPWHHNGPTDICPHFYKNKIGYQRIPKYQLDGVNVNADILNPLKRDEILYRLKTDKVVDVEITQILKNKDMVLIPHPFMSNDLTDKTVVMLDPMSSIVEHLATMQNCGLCINELLHNDNIRIGNNPLKRKGPKGVVVVAPKWKINRTR